MSYSITFGFWEAALLFLVSAQGLLIAYLHHPRWKVLLYTIPIPFVFGSLVVAKPIDVTHAMGALSIIPFAHAVRLLYYNARLPIIAAIIVPALSYCAIAAMLVKTVPNNSTVFWAVSAVVFFMALVFYFGIAPSQESGHRSPLPIWIKLPIVCGVVFFLILAKQTLSGFMAFFPMVGVITVYEARRSLWAVCRQSSIITLAIVPTIATVRLLQDRLGLTLAMLIGCVVFMISATPLLHRMWFRRAPGSPPVTLVETGSKPRL